MASWHAIAGDSGVESPQPDSACSTIRDLVSTLKLDLNNLPK